MSLPPNRTPFDNDLVTDPNAPRHTQPLPAQQPSSAPPAPPNTQSSTQSSLPSGPSTVSGAPPLPRQVIPDDDAPTKTTPLNARRVPMSVIVGLAMVGGAIGVVMLSGAFGRLAPRPDSPGVITAEQEQARDANQTAPLQTAPSTPRVIVVPPRLSTPGGTDQASSKSPNAKSNPDDASPNDASSDDAPTPDIGMPNDQAGRDGNSGSNRNSTTSSRDTNDTSNDDATNSDTPRNEDLSTNGNRNASRDNSDGNNDNGDDNGSAANGVVATSPRGIEYSNQGVKRRYVERKRSYSIRPPTGFQISQRGRRTVWQGPGKAQFLVEVGNAEGASPREGWEQLERGLQRKYGNGYRSYGIRDTTVNGREAAIWEFELRTPKGRVRKMDVAVHDGKNGYAVLGSAPAGDFENYRPSFERAISSLQIDGNNSDNSDRDQTDSSATAEGY